MPRRKSKEPKEVKPEAQPTIEKPVEAPAPAPKPEAQPTTPPTIPSPTPEGFTIRETTWEEFERFTPTPRKERSKSPVRQAYEMATSGKVVKIEGLSPAQVRAVVAAINRWNFREGNLVRVKYDVKAGVVYLAPAEKPLGQQ
jgi:hypothetical protein